MTWQKATLYSYVFPKVLSALPAWLRTKRQSAAAAFVCPEAVKAPKSSSKAPSWHQLFRALQESSSFEGCLF